MAQKLFETDSASRCVNACSRHIRICSQVTGTQGLVDSIKPVLDNLKTKNSMLEAAKDAEDDAYDSVKLADFALDNGVRKVSSHAKDFDRDNPAARTWETLFPGTDVTEIISANMMQEPVIVEQLAMRIEAFGAQHALASLAAELRELVWQSRKAIDNYENKIRESSTAKADVQIAVQRLVRQYESNIFSAIQMFGRGSANRLFPIVRQGTDAGAETQALSTTSSVTAS